jgi:hypothetical protein
MQILNILSDFLMRNYKWLITVFLSGGMVAIVKFVFFNRKEIIRVTKYERENSSIILEFYHEGKIRNENITMGLELYWFHFELIWGCVTNASSSVTLIKSDEISDHLSLGLFFPCRKVNITFAPFNPGDKYYILYKTNQDEKLKISNNKSMTIKEKKYNNKNQKRIEKNIKFEIENILYEGNSQITKLAEIIYKENQELMKTNATIEFLKGMQETLEIGRLNTKYKEVVK